MTALLRILRLTLLVALVPAAASARPVGIGGSGLQIDLPDGWKTIDPHMLATGKASTFWTLTVAQSKAMVSFAVVSEGEIGSTQRRIAGAVEAVGTELAFEAPEDIGLGGMTARRVKGTGQLLGERAHFRLVTVWIGGGRVVMASAQSRDTEGDAARLEVDAILGSIARAPNAPVPESGPIRTLPIGASGTQLTVPDGWRVMGDDSGAWDMVLKGPATVVMIMDVPTSEMKRAEAHVAEVIGAATDLTFDPPVDRTINGMPMQIRVGTSRVDGTRMGITRVTVRPFDDRVVVLLRAGLADVVGQRGFEALLHGIYRMTKPPSAKRKTPKRTRPTRSKTKKMRVLDDPYPSLDQPY